MPTPRSAFPPASYVPPDPPTARATSRSEIVQCEVAADIASIFCGVPVEEILTPHRARSAAARARHVAMYLAHVAFQLPLGDVARGFARDRTSIAHGVARIEDARDDEVFDGLLSQMEALAQSCRRLTGRGIALPGER